MLHRLIIFGVKYSNLRFNVDDLQVMKMKKIFLLKNLNQMRWCCTVFNILSSLPRIFLTEPLHSPTEGAVFPVCWFFCSSTFFSSTKFPIFILWLIHFVEGVSDCLFDQIVLNKYLK